MLPYNLDNLWSNEEEKIVQCIKEGTRNIKSYHEYRKQNPEDVYFLRDVYYDIKKITSFWTGKTYVGSKKTKQIKKAFQDFYQAFYELLIAFKTNAFNSISKIEKSLANDLLYQGNIYRYLGHGDCQETHKKIKTKYNDIWVSWSKEPENSYLESKLYGEYLKLYATIENNMYGIDLEALGVSKPNEKEVVFPTIRETINKEVSFRNVDFDYEEYEEDENFMLIQYIKIENEKISVNKTDNFEKVLKQAFNNNTYDARNYPFESDNDICVFTEDLSIHNKSETLQFCQNDQLLENFFGTVIFAKMNGCNFKSLSDKNVKLIINKLVKDGNIYKICN